MRLEKRIECVARQCEDKDVLDVGFIGGLHKEILKRAKTVVGIDNNAQIFQIQRENQKPDVCYIYADAENFNLNRKFDVIVAGELIEHLDNPGLFLDCVHRHLREDGSLVITTPNARHLASSIRDRQCCTGHIQLYTPNILTLLLKRHGFEVVSLQFFWAEPKNLCGKLYENFARFFPQFAFYFGVVAKISGSR